MSDSSSADAGGDAAAGPTSQTSAGAAVDSIVNAAVAARRAARDFKMSGKKNAAGQISDVEMAAVLREVAVSQLWKQAFEDEHGTVKAAAAATDAGGSGDDDTAYSTGIKRTFLQQYRAAEQLRENLPAGYNFQDDGVYCAPKLMQLVVASRLASAGCSGLGNWSDTGTGKTLSALLSAAHLGARAVLVLCPNNVAEQWCDMA